MHFSLFKGFCVILDVESKSLKHVDALHFKSCFSFSFSFFFFIFNRIVIMTRNQIYNPPCPRLSPPADLSDRPSHTSVTSKKSCTRSTPDWTKNYISCMAKSRSVWSWCGVGFFIDVTLDKNKVGSHLHVKHLIHMLHSPWCYQSTYVLHTHHRSIQEYRHSGLVQYSFLRADKARSKQLSTEQYRDIIRGDRTWNHINCPCIFQKRVTIELHYGHRFTKPSRVHVHWQPNETRVKHGLSADLCLWRFRETLLCLLWYFKLWMPVAMQRPYLSTSPFICYA